MLSKGPFAVRRLDPNHQQQPNGTEERADEDSLNQTKDKNHMKPGTFVGKRQPEGIPHPHPSGKHLHRPRRQRSTPSVRDENHSVSRGNKHEGNNAHEQSDSDCPAQSPRERMFRIIQSRHPLGANRQHHGKQQHRAKNRGDRYRKSPQLEPAERNRHAGHCIQRGNPQPEPNLKVGREPMENSLMERMLAAKVEE